MKTKSICLIALFLNFILLGCKEQKKEVVAPESAIEAPSTDKTNDSVDKGENLNAFLARFNKDKDFQLSRIVFPLKIVQLNMEVENEADFDMHNYYVPKAEWEPIDVFYTDRDYKQTIEEKGNEATVKQRGINNGIYIDYHFKKKEGHWFLETYTDEST